MPEIIGFELGNSAKSIDCRIWTIGGALPRIIELMAESRSERYASSSEHEEGQPTTLPVSEPSAEALLDLVLDKSAARDSEIQE
jgi:hypothetical protein